MLGLKLNHVSKWGPWCHMTISVAIEPRHHSISWYHKLNHHDTNSSHLIAIRTRPCFITLRLSDAYTSVIRWWLIACHCLHQYSKMINLTLRNKLRGNFNRNSYIFILRKSISKYRLETRGHFDSVPMCYFCYHCVFIPFGDLMTSMKMADETVKNFWNFNSSWWSGVIWLHKSGSTLIRLMVCRLFGTKPLF